MKNTHIKNLHQVVPEKIRLRIYKKVLKDLEKTGRCKNSVGLCLILPTVLWDLDDLLDKCPDGSFWSWRDTGKAFPELTQKVLSDIFQSNNILEIRKVFLRTWIKNLESK